jgi:hypothetical protein
MNPAELRAIDVHTHAEVSAREAPDELWVARTNAMAKYFKGATDRPTVPQVAAYYRERKIGCVIFPVDSERASGERRVSNRRGSNASAFPRVHSISLGSGQLRRLKTITGTIRCRVLEKRQIPSLSGHCSCKSAPGWLSTGHLAAGVDLNLLEHLGNLQRI